MKWNHPSHPHPLTESDPVAIYSAYEGKWRCDVCGRVFNGKRAPSRGAYRDPSVPDNWRCYHCSRCKFDICSACFVGHLHTFHRHRLKRARTTIIYKEHDGLWHCDACRTVHSEYTEQLCYHCEKCEVDLCSSCFEGKWDHSLHRVVTSMPERHQHTLRPINPSIEYRIYQEWTCDNCRQIFSCRRDEMIAFHCDECNFDLCKTCFVGEKHPFHSHPLVAVETGSRTWDCSHCNRAICDTKHYQCIRKSCEYRLCVNCFSKQLEIHPYHQHPLHVCDPQVVYPQSGGMWHCDRCTVNATGHRPVALSHMETMYHCEQCEFDLCYSCFSEGQTRIGPVQVTEDVSFTASAPELSTNFTFDSSGYGTYQPYSRATYYTPQEYHSRLSSPLVTGIQSFLSQHGPLSLSNTLCAKCNAKEATVTFSHSGKPHMGRALYCDSCAYNVVRNYRPCPVCGEPPDGTSRPLR